MINIIIFLVVININTINYAIRKVVLIFIHAGVISTFLMSFRGGVLITLEYS